MAVLSGQAGKRIVAIGLAMLCIPLALVYLFNVYSSLTVETITYELDIFFFYPSSELLFHSNGDIRARAVENLTEGGLTHETHELGPIVRYMAESLATPEELGRLDQAFERSIHTIHISDLEILILDTFCKQGDPPRGPGAAMLLSWLERCDARYAEHFHGGAVDCAGAYGVHQILRKR